MKREEMEQRLPGVSPEGLDWLMNEASRQQQETQRLKEELAQKTQQLSGYDPAWQQKARQAALDARLSAAIERAGGRSEAAVRALLDMDALAGAEDEKAAIHAALTQLKGQHSYLFEPEAPAAYSGQVGTASDSPAPEAALRAAFGL